MRNSCKGDSGGKRTKKAIILAGDYLRLCSDDGLYEYFRLWQAFYLHIPAGQSPELQGV